MIGGTVYEAFTVTARYRRVTLIGGRCVEHFESRGIALNLILNFILNFLDPSIERPLAVAR
jgi:hypothetical protein